MDSAPAPNCSKAGGNTKTPAESRFWTFTLNNYTIDDIDQIQSCSSVPFIRFQTEIAKSGTPHLQGAIAYGTRCKGRPFSLGWTKDVHWEKKIKASTPYQMFAYCKKELTYDGKLRYDRGDIDGTFKDKKSKSEAEVEIVHCEDPNPRLNFLTEMIDSYDYFKGGDRKLHIVVDHIGGLGKTEYCRWLYMNRKRVIVSGGKAADMKNQIIEYQKVNAVFPQIILFDVPRHVGSDYLSYGGIEEIKNMFFYSGKYEGGMVCGNKPVVILFMNECPDLTKWSPDRCRVYEIHNEGLAVQDEVEDFGLDNGLKPDES